MAASSEPLSEPGQRPLYIIPPAGEAFSDEHERCTRMAVGRLLAKLGGFAFAGELAGEVDSGTPAYFLPADTLLAEDAERYGISGEDDLFGGVVPSLFVGTKAIAHGLLRPDAERPPGWNEEMPGQVADVVLPGFTAFSRSDAEAAGRELLRDGPVQVKSTGGFAGFGQAAATNDTELSAALDEQRWDKIGYRGLVIERRLKAFTSFSVGQVRFAGLTASYFGLQKESVQPGRDHLYEGTALLAVRGGFDALLGVELSQAGSVAVEQASRFDAAVDRCYPQVFASRRNYDVIRGFDESGAVLSGVLEQSWRFGGASGAEALALKAFLDRPGQQWMKARTIEVFGQLVDVPGDALQLYRGVDPHAGPLTKYAIAER